MMAILILIYKQSSNSMYNRLPGMVQSQSMIWEYIIVHLGSEFDCQDWTSRVDCVGSSIPSLGTC